MTASVNAVKGTAVQAEAAKKTEAPAVEVAKVEAMTQDEAMVLFTDISGIVPFKVENKKIETKDAKGYKLDKLVILVKENAGKLLQADKDKMTKKGLEVLKKYGLGAWNVVAKSATKAAKKKLSGVDRDSYGCKIGSKRNLCLVMLDEGKYTAKEIVEKVGITSSEIKAIAVNCGEKELVKAVDGKLFMKAFSKSAEKVETAPAKVAPAKIAPAKAAPAPAR
jgi:hypothetical protein